MPVDVVTLVHTRYLMLRIAAIAVGIIIIFLFAWVGNRVFDRRRRYPTWVRPGWVLGIILCVYTVFLAALTL